MIAGEILRAVVRYAAPSASEGQNIFHWQLQGSGTGDQIAADKVLDWLTNAWGPTWSNIAGEDTEIESVQTDVVSNTGALVRAVDFALLGLAGQLGFNVSPAAVAAYIALKTAVPRVTGSKYIPFVAEETTDKGSFDASTLVAMGQLLLFYFDDLSLSTGDILETGVVSNKVIDFVPFTASADIDAIPAYQRRRKAGVGI